MHTLYTAGYARWSVDQLQSDLQRLDALLLDIRLSPTSQRAEWTRAELIRRVGSAYRHLPELGNRNAFTDQPMALAAPARAVPVVRDLLRDQPVILLCGCADVQRCHRRLAAEYLAAALEPLSVVHLDPPPPVPADDGFLALTLWQPWASLIALHALAPHNGKWCETRSWVTSHRGTLVIHAAQGGLSKRDLHDLCAREPFTTSLGLLGYQRPDQLPRGAVVAVADLAACVQTEALWGDLVDPDSPNAQFGDYAPGRWGWVLRDIRPVVPPIAARGGQQLWRWTPPPGVVLPTVGSLPVPPTALTDTAPSTSSVRWDAPRLPGF